MEGAKRQAFWSVKTLEYLVLQIVIGNWESGSFKQDGRIWHSEKRWEIRQGASGRGGGQQKEPRSSSRLQSKEADPSLQIQIFHCTWWPLWRLSVNRPHMKSRKVSSLWRQLIGDTKALQDAGRSSENFAPCQAMELEATLIWKSLWDIGLGPGWRLQLGFI